MKCSGIEFLGLIKSLKEERESLCFEARGKSMEPYINDGEIVWLRYTGYSFLRPGDIVLYSDEFKQPAIHRLIKKSNGYAFLREDAPPFRMEKIGPDDMLARVIAIERGGKRIELDKWLTRINSFFLARAFFYFKINFMIKKFLKLFSPYWFVPDAEASLKSVSDKYNIPEEVIHHSQAVDDGLEKWELDFVNRFTGKKGEFLDIGCGAGREAIALAKLGFNVTAIDAAAAMIDEARKKARDRGLNINFENRCAPYLEYSDNSFDYVLLSTGIYSYIPGSALRIKTLQEISRILRPGGRAIFSYYTREKNIFSRLTITDIGRKLGKIFLKHLITSEPGDIILRYVSPASSPQKRCFCHFFKGRGEVMKEVMSAKLKVLEKGEGGYFVVEK